MISDGDQLALGNTIVTFMDTPGHTKGTISLFFDTQDGENTYRVAMFGGAGVNTMYKDHFDYDGCREDFRASIHRLRNERVDVVLGNHVGHNDTVNKGRLLLETGENRFVDGDLWQSFLRRREQLLDEVIANDL